MARWGRLASSLGRLVAMGVQGGPQDSVRYGIGSVTLPIRLRGLTKYFDPRGNS